MHISTFREVVLFIGCSPDILQSKGALVRFLKATIEHFVVAVKSYDRLFILLVDSKAILKTCILDLCCDLPKVKRFDSFEKVKMPTGPEL
jgi:hypothetical protein